MRLRIWRLAAASVISSLIALGCNSASPATSDVPSASTEPSPTQPATPSASAPPSVTITPQQSPTGTSGASIDAELIAPGRLSICSAFPRVRFAEFDAAGNPFGVDVDIGLALADELSLESDVQEVLFDDLIGAVVDQRCDIAISGHFITQERLAQIDLVPYREGRISPVVLAGNPLAVETLADLCGQEVAIVAGTIYHDIIRGLGEYAGEGIDQQCEQAGAPIVTLTEFQTEDEAVASLAANDSAAFIGNEAIAVERPTEFELSAAELPRLLNGIGHRLDSPLLDEAIRAGLRTMIGDGSYAAILERYGASSVALTEQP